LTAPWDPDIWVRAENAPSDPRLRADKPAPKGTWTPKPTYASAARLGCVQAAIRGVLERLGSVKTPLSPQEAPRLNVHQNARLTPQGRAQVVQRVERGECVRAVAHAVGVTDRTVRKWVTRAGAPRRHLVADVLTTTGTENATAVFASANAALRMLWRSAEPASAARPIGGTCHPRAAQTRAAAPPGCSSRSDRTRPPAP
jgi:transposase-like protein